MILQLFRHGVQGPQPAQRGVVHARVPERPEGAPEVVVVPGRHVDLLVAVEHGEDGGDGPVLGDEGVRLFDADAADVGEEVAAGEHAQLEELLVLPTDKVQRTLGAAAGFGPGGSRARASLPLAPRAAHDCDAVLIVVEFVDVTHRVRTVRIVGSLGRGSRHDVLQQELLRVSKLVKLEQNQGAPVSHEVGVFGEDDVHPAWLALGAELGERGDLRVRLIRGDDKLETLALQSGDELVRHGGSDVEPLRKHERRPVAISGGEPLVALAHALGASLAAFLLLAPLGRQPVAVEDDNRCDAVVPQHLRPVDAVAHVRGIAPLPNPPPVVGAELEGAAVRTLMQPAVRVDGRAFAGVFADLHRLQPRPQHLRETLDTHQPLAAASSARDPLG